MKKILGSVGVLALVGAVVLGATGAFFSDTETSTGNTFTAGAIDLKIDSQTHYNGNECKNITTGDGDPVYQWVGNALYPVPGTACTGSWTIKDLTVEHLFDFADIKPGDKGENTISLHVLNNDSWVCAAVSNLTDLENGRTEPEALVDTTNDDVGELSKAMEWVVWRDDGGTGGVSCDNVKQDGEQVLTSGHPVNGVLPVYDSTTRTVAGAPTGPLKGDATACLGVAWELPAASGNETQTDKMTGDIKFTVEQSRNNDNFKCIPSKPIQTVVHTQEGFGDGGWAGWSCPSGTTAVGGGIDSSTHSANGGLAAPGAPAVDGSNYPIYPHHTFTTGDTGYVVHDVQDGLGNSVTFHIDCQAN